MNFIPPFHHSSVPSFYLTRSRQERKDIFDRINRIYWIAFFLTEFTGVTGINRTKIYTDYNRCTLEIAMLDSECNENEQAYSLFHRNPASVSKLCFVTLAPLIFQARREFDRIKPPKDLRRAQGFGG